MPRFLTLLCVALAMIGLRAVAADEYPTRPIRIVVPYTPGGSTDVLARLIAESLQGTLGQPVFIDNRVDVATIVGTELVVRSAPELLRSDPLARVARDIGVHAGE